MMIHPLYILFLFLLTWNYVAAYNIFPSQYSVIQENTEVVVDIERTEKRFYLHITDEYSPFFLYITPCGAPVHWQLFTLNKELPHSEEFSLVSDLSNKLDQSEKFHLIAGEEDTKRMTFFAHRLPRKLILVVSSSSSDYLSSSSSTTSSSVRIFFSPSLFRIEDQYPPLPHDTRLATTLENVKDDVEARVTWKIATKVKNGEAGRYRICAIVARRDAKWAGVCDHVEEGVESIKCVPQSNNSVVIERLRRDKQYFISVFVRDYKRGTSSSYETQTIQTTAVRKVPRGIPRRQKKTMSGGPRALINSKMQSMELEAKKGAMNNYRFMIPTTSNVTQSAMLIVHACDGLVRINIFRNGRILKKSDAFSGFRRFVVTNIRSGHLRIQIVNDDDKLKNVRIWASTDLSTSPYPILPDDTSIKIVGRSCESASIQWLRAHDNNVKYCVYRRKENSNFLEHLVSLVDNLCEGGLSSSTLVGCYTHSAKYSPDQYAATALIETTIAGLDAASTYRFDLLATPLERNHAQALPYRTVWVRTNQSCQILPPL